MIVTGTECPELREYFEAKIGQEVDPDGVFIGRLEGGVLKGVIAFWDWAGWDCEVGWAGEPGWVSRKLLKVAFSYIFVQLNCRRCTGRINADNAVALDMSRRLGFAPEGVLRQGNRHGDVHVLGMLRDECKWL